MSKVLVAYFSTKGATAKVAEELCKAENGDLFEIKPVKDSRSNLEMADESCRPGIIGMVDDMGQYDVVFVGFPVWWGREPSIIDTFLESYDLTGKKVIPFCTSGMSDCKKATEHIKGIVGDGVIVEEGKRLGAEGSEEEVRLWTELLSL